MAYRSSSESDLSESEAPEVAEAAIGNAAGPSVNRKRCSFAIEDKLLAVRRMKQGTSERSLSLELGVSRKQLYNWKKQEETLLKQKNKRSSRRLPGAGRKNYYPEIDRRLLEWFMHQRERNLTVIYSDLRRFLLSKELGVPLPEGFKISDKYLFLWTRRNRISSRRITHHGQIDNRRKSDIQGTTADYLISVRQKIADLSGNQVFNMDEVPCYYDMVRDSTLAFSGPKNVDASNTGQQKQRYTVCLAISLDGRLLKTLIIFRNLKNVPNVNVPNNVIVLVSKSGSMDSKLAKQWFDKVFSGRGPYFSTKRSVLIWDSYGSHKREDVVDYLKTKYNSNMILIPPKATSFCQPLDVAINSSFKAALKSEWQAWLTGTPPVYTPAGYRQRPSYQAIIDMVANASDTVTPEKIIRAFECCGIVKKGEEVQAEKLNEQLKLVLSWKKETGLVENQEIEDENDDDGAGADSGEEALFQVNDNEEMSSDDDIDVMS